MYFTLQYLIESTLVDADPFLKFTPSAIAAAAVCLANIVMGRQAWVSREQPFHSSFILMEWYFIEEWRGGGEKL